MTSQPDDYVLIVDDDADIGETIEFILRSHGYRCAAASGGAEALERLRTGPLPRVILLDIMMPGMSGTEFRAAQLGDPRIAGVPVVVMTGDSKADQKGSALGAARVLRKPLSIDDLIAAVEATS